MLSGIIITGGFIPAFNKSVLLKGQRMMVCVVYGCFVSGVEGRDVCGEATVMMKENWYLVNNLPPDYSVKQHLKECQEIFSEDSITFTRYQYL